MNDKSQVKSDLKPCPFCGGDVESDSERGFINYKGNLASATAIYCVKCNCEMSMCHGDFPNLSPDDLMAILRAAWNVRVPTPTDLDKCEVGLKEAEGLIVRARRWCHLNSTDIEWSTDADAWIKGGRLKESESRAGRYERALESIREHAARTGSPKAAKMAFDALNPPPTLNPSLLSNATPPTHE